MGAKSEGVIAELRRESAALRRLVESLQQTVSALRAENEGLRAEVKRLAEENASLRARNVELQARVGTNSRNSSKPPSSDGPAAPPRPERRPTGRRSGGQPGHPRHERQKVPPERVDRVVNHWPPQCERCCRPLGEGPTVGDPGRHQVIELPELRAHVTEHRRHSRRCRGCGHVTEAAFAGDVPRGHFGPRLLGVTSLLSGRYRLSRREVADIFEEVFKIPLSVGMVSNTCERAGELMAPAAAEVHRALIAATHLNADETGYACAGEKGWLWTLVGSAGALFSLTASRGADVAHELLDGFTGYLGTDRWRAYEWYPIERRQLCWAHLKRNAQGIVDRGAEGAPLGEAAVALIEGMFVEWHDHARDRDRRALSAAMQPFQAAWSVVVDCMADSTDTKAHRLGTDMRRLWTGLWTFITAPGVEPTNNAAERAIRPAVLWRKGSFGTRSDGGARFVERVLTVAATCRRQARSLLDFLVDLFEADLHGVASPSLLNSS